MPAEKKDGTPSEDLRVVEKNDGSAYVPGVYAEGHETGEDRDGRTARDPEDDDDAREPGASANGEPGSDAELAQAETDEEREAIRARRRQERADKKRRAAEKVETLERELAEMRAQNAAIMQNFGAIERRASSNDLAQIDEALRVAGANVEKLKAAIARGTTAGDGALVANATFQLQQEMQRGSALHNAKQAYLQQEQQRGTQAQQTRPDSRVVNNARAWAQRNSWYDPAGGNEESAIVRAIDQSLSAEGRSPADPSYFDELDSRIRRYLPHKFSGKMPGNAQGKPSGSARVAGSGSESTGNGGSSAKGFTVSSARVQALKEAGKWDDPAARAKAIEAYRKYDREHGATR